MGEKRTIQQHASVKIKGSLNLP